MTLTVQHPRNADVMNEGPGANSLERDIDSRFRFSDKAVILDLFRETLGSYSGCSSRPLTSSP